MEQPVFKPAGLSDVFRLAVAFAPWVILAATLGGVIGVALGYTPTWSYITFLVAASGWFVYRSNLVCVTLETGGEQSRQLEARTFVVRNVFRTLRVPPQR